MKAVLEFQNADLYRGSRQVLAGLNFRVQAGEMVAVVGPNGAGKSTLLEACLGQIESKNGRILLLEKELRAADFSERAKLVGFSGREELEPHGLTVTDIVRLGAEVSCTSPELLERELARLLRELDLVELAARPLNSLSSGERQRVHFARVLGQSPALLLLDEAVAHLDLGHRESAAARTRSFASSGGTVLSVVHELEYAVRHFERILVLFDGRLVADGSPTQILTSELLAQVFHVRAQVEVIRNEPHLLVEGQA